MKVDWRQGRELLRSNTQGWPPVGALMHTHVHKYVYMKLLVKYITFKIPF